MAVIKQTKKYLPPKQRQVLDFVADYMLEHGYAPSQYEIAQGVRCSRSLVQFHINRLRDLGFIRLTDSPSRNIEVVHRQ